MYIQPSIHNPIYFKAIPMIDGEFDPFLLSHDLEMQRCETEITNFYYEALNDEE